MKKYALVYWCLFVINVHAAEDWKQITIFNKNVGTIRVNVDYMDFDSDKIIWHCSNKYNISYNTMTWLNLIGHSPIVPYPITHKNIYTLCFDNKILPSRVQLINASHGDHIIVSCDDQGVVTINNKTRNTVFKCINGNTPITIGSYPMVHTPISNVKQTIHIKNKDLVQVLVQHMALRNEYQQACLNSNIWLESQFKSTDNNMIAKSKDFSLQAGEEGTLKTYLSTSSNITKTLTVLRFPQSPQIVLVNFNDGELNSGDTLEVSLHNNDAQIAIAKVTDEGNKILALLYANSLKGLSAVF